MEKRNSNFIPNLTLIFITLKLCSVINWSWILVLCPIIIHTTLLVSLYLLTKLQEKLQKQIEK